MFFLKYKLQDKDFKSIVEFSEAVTEFMKEFSYWFNNLGAWVDTFYARKAYYFDQLGWTLGDGKTPFSDITTQLIIKSKTRQLGLFGPQIQLTGDFWCMDLATGRHSKT